MSTTAPDPVDVLSRLIACPSVTPDDAGAFDYVEGLLGAAGWRTERVTFSEPGTPDVANLIATRGEGAPHLVFSGHVDVVPPGDAARWSRPPFSGAVADGYVHGRGAVDMKGGIAAFIAAAVPFAAARDGRRRDRDALPHRRRGGALGQRHRQAPRPCAEGGDALRCGHRRRADVAGKARRHGQDRPARQPLGVAPGHRPAGPRRLSPSRRQPGAGADPPPPPADHAQARRGQHRFPAVESRGDQRRCRQSGRQRHSGGGDGPVQRPLQRPLVAREPHRLPPRRARCRGGGRALRADPRPQQRVVPHPLGRRWSRRSPRRSAR